MIPAKKSFTATGPLSIFRRRRRAVILILSLWIAMILSMMAYSVAYELRLNLRLSGQSQNKLKARALARAGLAKAVIDLKNDKLLLIVARSSMNSDSFRDVWARPEDKTDVELGGGVFTVSVEDDESKLNLNFLNEQNAPILGQILRRIGDFDRITADMIARMIVDFQDPDLFALTGAGLSEAVFYTQWGREEFGGTLPADWVFRPKNDLMLNLEELLVFPGITRALLFGRGIEPVERQDGRRRRRRGDPLPSLSHYVTVQSGRWLNVNTVSQLVLEGLLRFVLPTDTAPEGMAQDIVNYRTDLMNSDGPESSILNINQLEQVGLSRAQIARMNTIYPLNVSSRYYTLTSRGEYGGIVKTLQVRVTVALEPFNVNPGRPETFGRRDPEASGLLDNRWNQIIDPVIRVLEIRDI